MNLERMLTMIVRRLMMRFVNRGVDAGLNKVSQKMKRPKRDDTSV